MEFVIKCLFLGGQYATQAAGEVIVTIIKGGVNLHKNLAQKYENMVRFIEFHENMLEHLNAFNQNTDHDKVDHPRIGNETGNCEVTRAKSDILNKLHSYSILQKPPISKCVDIVKNQNLTSLSNDGFHDHEEIYSDHYKHLYENFRGTSTEKEQNVSGTTKTRQYDYNSHKNITSPENLHKPKQLEPKESRKFIKKTFPQSNLLTSSVQFLSYQMLSLKSTKKEIVNKTSNVEASDVEKLSKEERDHLENPRPDQFFDCETNENPRPEQFFDCETDENFLKSSASTSHELKKQSVLNDDKPIKMKDKFSEHAQNVPNNLPKLIHVENESKLSLTNEEEPDLKKTGTIKNKVGVSEAQELATFGEPISTTTKFEDPTQYEAALEKSCVNQSSSLNTKRVYQSTNDETKNLNEQPKMLKAAQTALNLEENAALDGLPSCLEKNEEEPSRSLELNGSAEDNENDEALADFSEDTFFITTEKINRYKDDNKLDEMLRLTNNSALTSVATETDEVNVEDAVSNKEQRKDNEDRLPKLLLIRDYSFSNVSEENATKKIGNPKKFKNTQSKEDECLPVLKVAKAAINVEENTAVDELPPSLENNDKESQRSLELNDSLEDDENGEGPADSNVPNFLKTTEQNSRCKEDFNKLKEMQQLTNNSILTSKETETETGETNMEDDDIVQIIPIKGQRKNNEDSLPKLHLLRDDSFSNVSEENSTTKITNLKKFKNTQSHKDEFSPVLKVAIAAINAKEGTAIDDLPPSVEKNDKEPSRSPKLSDSIEDNDNHETLTNSSEDTCFITTEESNRYKEELTNNSVLTSVPTETGKVRNKEAISKKEKRKSNKDRTVDSLPKHHLLRDDSFSNVFEENFATKITNPTEFKNTQSDKDKLSPVLKVAKGAINVEEKELSRSLELTDQLDDNENDEALAASSVHNTFITTEENNRYKEDINKLEEMQQATNNSVETTETDKVNMEDDKIIQAVSNEEQKKNDDDRTVDSLSKPHFGDDSSSNVPEENFSKKITNPKKFDNIQSNKEEFSPMLNVTKAAINVEENAAPNGLPPTLESKERKPPRSLELNDSHEDNENDEALADSNVDTFFISTEESNRCKEDFNKSEEMQQPTNNSVQTTETDKVNMEDDNIMQAMSNKKQRQNNADVDRVVDRKPSKPYLLRDYYFSNVSEEKLATKIRNARKLKNIFDYSDDIYVLPDISSTRFPNNNVYKEEISGRSMMLIEEEEEGSQNMEYVKSPATSPNVAQGLTPILEDKKTEVSKVVQVTYLTRPHFFNYEILSTNKKENDSKSNSSTEAKNQTRELHDTSFITQKSSRLKKLERDAFKSLTVKEFHLHESFANELLYTINFEHCKNFAKILNDKCVPHFTKLNQTVSKQALKETRGSTETNSLSKPPKYNEFLTNYTNFLLRSKSNNFLKDYFIEYAQANYLQSSVLFYTTFARTMMENLTKERQAVNRGNENQLFKEMREISKRATASISAESAKCTKSSTPNIFSTEQESVTFSLNLHQSNKPEKPLSIKTKNFELYKNITPEKCTEIVHADKSELRTLKLPTKHEVNLPKFSGNQQQLVKKSQEQHHKKLIKVHINHIRRTQTSMRKGVIPNLKSGLQKVDLFGIKKFSKVNNTPREIKKLLAPYLKNETKVILANQKAFYKLEQKVTQYLIQLNMRVLNKNKCANEISLEKTFRRGFSKSPPTENKNQSSENCEEENSDDKLAGKSILYIFFMAFLNFASEQEFPLFP